MDGRLRAPRALLMALALMGAVGVGGGAASGAPAQEPSLRELAQRVGLRIGFAAANDFWALPDAATYMAVAAREFDILTPENQMKWDTIHPTSDTFNFEPADRHVSFALAHGMAVHGHTLVWHNQLPAWLTTRQWSPGALEQVLEEHIRQVVGHFRGRVAVWDVVNEALDEDGSYRRSFWYVNLGPGYVEKAFVWAREADPGAVLLYNDYNIEVINPKSDALYRMMADFKRRGVPVDGVGFQMHITEDGIDYDSFRRNLQRFADLGLSLYITEMDVRIRGEPDMARLLRQAEVYRRILEICLQQPQVKAVQFWGFTDRYSWIPGAFPGQGAALLFDPAYQPKPAYYALKEALSAFAAAFKPYKGLTVARQEGQRYEVAVRVQNTGTQPETRTVELRVNGQPVAAQTVPLLPREERLVTFAHTFERRGIHRVTVGDLPPVEVTIPGQLSLLQPAVWLDFEGGLDNRAPSGVTARALGDAVLTGEGRFGGGLSLHGDGRVQLDDPLARASGGETSLTIPAEGSFTLALWFKPLFPEGAAGPFALLDASRNPFYFAVDITRQGVSWYYEDGADADFQMEVPYPLESGRWYHLAVTGAFGRPGTMKVYIDGEAIASREIAPSRAGRLSPLTIGHDADPTYFPAHVGFSGVVDEVRIFPWSLSAEEIRALMATRSFSPEPGTHTTQWVALEPGEALRSLTARARVGAGDRIEAVVETSPDGEHVAQQATLSVADGERTYALDLAPAAYFRIRTRLSGFGATVEEYEVQSSAGRRWLWSTTDDWARGTWSANVDLGAPVQPEQASQPGGQGQATGGPPATSLQDGFEEATGLWRARGDGVRVSRTTAAARSGQYSLQVEGRSAGWHGAEMDLVGRLEPGRTYRLSIWVRPDSDAPRTLILTVQRTVGDSPRGWDRVAQVTAAPGQWTQLAGTYTLPAGAPLKEAILYVESDDPSLSFYLDDFSAVPASP